MDALEAYRTEMEDVKVKHPNEITVSDIEWKVTERIQKVMQNATKQRDGNISESESEYEMEDQHNEADVGVE